MTTRISELKCFLILAISGLTSGLNAQENLAPGTPLKRTGDEIVACGQLFHIGTPVVLWTDAGGYDAYRVDRRFVPLDQANWEATQKAGGVKSPNRYGMRTRGLTAEQIEKRRAGWELNELQQVVDQFVIHFDARGTAKTCFQVLHDMRGLSVHFMLDLDGTIYQTLDLKESAWHATISNGRSIGIEIANVGAYAVGGKNPFEQWYFKGDDGKTAIKIPGGLEKSGIRNQSILLHPDRNELVKGNIQGQNLEQYDLTPQQYAALARLTAALCTIFPKIKCDYPKDASGGLITQKLSENEFKAYSGILGHYHVQSNKVDPGPAFQWERLLRETRSLMVK